MFHDLVKKLWQGFMKNAAWPMCSNLIINQVLENILKWDQSHWKYYIHICLQLRLNRFISCLNRFKQVREKNETTQNCLNQFKSAQIQIDTIQTFLNRLNGMENTFWATGSSQKSLFWSPSYPKRWRSFSKVRMHHLDSFCNNTKQLMLQFTYFFEVSTTTTYTQSTHISHSFHEMTLSTTLNNNHNSQSWIQPQFNNTISQFINLSKIYKVPISI